VLYRNYRNKHQRLKRKSYPFINNLSSDSNRSYHVTVRTKDDFSLKSDEYRSDSYQLLMPHGNNSFRPMDKIDEDKPVNRNPVPNIYASRNIESANEVLEINLSKITNDIDSNSRHGNTGPNSSNVSLPLSPELSIVENLSVSKELLKIVNSQPTLNEVHASDLIDDMNSNKYSICHVDVSMPLMQQSCDIHKSANETMTPSSSKKRTNKSVFSQSLLHKINTVDIAEEQSLSESLDIRLKNLLLDSAKKIQERIYDNVDDKEVKKTRAKRCSTPRKKKTINPKSVKVNPVIEEEHMETCSYGGRKSCPPVINIINTENLLAQIEEPDKPIVTNNKTTGRKKKDVIKVKILRPKDKNSNITKSPKKSKSLNKENILNSINNTSSTHAVTDSGINDTEAFSPRSNDSVDLIHNHSETCLQAHECIVGDSVEFIETSAQSIISLNSDSNASSDKIQQTSLGCINWQDTSSKEFCDLQNLTKKYGKLSVHKLLLTKLLLLLKLASFMCRFDYNSCMRNFHNCWKILIRL
jgi:hypothetical protein